MATNWCSEENLRLAWRYVKKDIRDDFVFDVINNADIEDNLELVISTLSTQLKTNQYHPAPLLQIGVPKNDHSSRPGTSISIIDLIVLYAIAQRLAPMLDSLLCDSVYSFRLNPSANRSGHHLFARKSDTNSKEQTEIEDELDGEFPYDWFSGWKQFNQASIDASGRYEYVAVTDITAYFEDISLDILREQLIGWLGNDHRELIDRLFRMLEFWDWSPTRNLPHRIGLPQGNDVSSFLSNLYLVDLDRALLQIVNGDSSKYYRYVDDIKVFTSDYDEACMSLVRLEKNLRLLNLNVQSAKTKIQSAKTYFKKDVEIWLERMDRSNPDRFKFASQFFEEIIGPNQLSENPDQLEKWQRPYLRCLSLMREAEDDRAIETALSLFFRNPAQKLLTKHFNYLRHFVTSHYYSSAIADRLEDPRFMFFYHRAFMYRLAAYSRDENERMKKRSLEESLSEANWYCKTSALFCLHSFNLEAEELGGVTRIIRSVERPQVIRSAYVVLLQHGGSDLASLIDQAALFSAPRQDYLRRYFLRLFNAKSTEIGRLNLRQASVSAPTFIYNLHKLDLLKGSTEYRHRQAFSELLDSKIRDCENAKWPRLLNRLKQIRELFISRPQR